MRRGMMVVALCGTMGLAGCAEQGGPGQGQMIGTGAGAAVGGAVGYLVGGRSATGAVIGAVVGGLVGNRIGAMLDEREQQRLAQASTRAAEGRTGERIAWTSQDDAGRTTASGWVMPVEEERRTADGTPCRKVKQSADKGGRSSEQEVTLCRGSSGWVMPS